MPWLFQTPTSTLLGYAIALNQYYNGGSNAPLYWVNGSLSSLPLPTGDTGVNFANSAVNGSDVYFAGTSGVFNASASSTGYLNSTPQHAVYWKNGSLTSLPVTSGATSAGVSSVLVSSY